MLFKYSTTSPTQNEFDSLPRITLKLKRDNQQIEAIGLVDSGATVNILPSRLEFEIKPTSQGRSRFWVRVKKAIAVFNG